MKIINRKIKELIRAEYNPRELTKDQYNQLKDSLLRFGIVDPVIINKHPDRLDIIVGGHQRSKVWEDLGNDSIPCVEVNLTLEKEKELNVRLNKNTGQFDMDMLANHFDTDELLDWGFTEQELDFFEPESLEAEEDDYSIPDEVHTDIVLGDLIEIGEHRLLCGDSTDSDQVAKLMDGQKADISFTSPPYNAGTTPTEVKMGKTSKYENDDDNKSNNEYLNLLITFTNNTLIYSEYSFVNIQSLSGNKVALIDFLFQMKPMYADTLIWQKGSAQPAMANNVLNSQFEYVHCFSHKANRSIGVKKFRGTISNVVEISKQSKNKIKSHNATFPIDFSAFFVSNFSDNSVLDLFLGSGTTMAACHQLNRKCYGMELDPKYCQVIVDRMMKLDDKLAVKVNGKEYKPSKELANV